MLWIMKGLSEEKMHGFDFDLTYNLKAESKAPVLVSSLTTSEGLVQVAKYMYFSDESNMILLILDSNG